MAGVPGVAPLDETDPVALGPYLLLGRLGDGGMGSVYLARHEHAAEDGPPEQVLVAVKVIRRDLARVPAFRERFLREAQAARSVARFCTAEVLDVSTDGTRPFLVTEYVAGPTLLTAVDRGGPLPGPELERLAVATASALTAIHHAGVVHRDLKPGNILLSSTGARVIDFGIARALDLAPQTHGLVGTPAFMAPEQAAGEPAGPAADIHAWGAVLLFAATGRPPFGDGPAPAVLRRVVAAEPDLDALPAGLRDLVARTMAKDAAARPTADELLLALHHLRSRPSTPPTDAPPTGGPPAIGRLGWPVGEPDRLPSRGLSAGRLLAGRRLPVAAAIALMLAAAGTVAVLTTSDGDTRAGAGPPGPRAHPRPAGHRHGNHRRRRQPCSPAHRPPGSARRSPAATSG